MVKKSVLEKLPNKELEKFILPDSRKVPEAIKLAYEILLERGREFSDEEKERVEAFIDGKVQEENEKEFKQIRVFDKKLTDNENAIPLYTNFAIFMISLLFGVMFGYILAMINYIILKKYGLAFILFIIGILLLFLSIFLIQNFLPEAQFYDTFESWLFAIVLAGVGLLIIHLFNQNFISKQMSYRSRSITIPLIFIIIFQIVRFIYVENILNDGF
ncbi:hypothetical protein [Sphingobacterium cellulitidis]|uniref:Uncharacterized protein n=1 Tax=Sphingobacterium cellulitidis TaxID=1768011 RepID=A0A8H9KTX5_9SPHI|nr:hypothetical protein [Sphingobacterium soli]MBA8987196.1 magnesium-transporting ATPase (P-type) [Sphingobacterium soli]GGE17131.1 hypothetical protein GCM10011516_13560 [Sphingobacterium soli]